MTDPTRQPSLDRLIARLSDLIGAATETLAGDPSRADAWYDEVARQLRRYTLAAYMSGANTRSLDDAAQRKVAALTKAQLDYLSAFRDEVKGADDWKPGWAARAQMYADSIANSYWSGKTRGWALPAMPADGTTQCLTHCKCAWEVQELAGDGNADAYWRLGAAEHCQTCTQRAHEWSPLQIRNGELL